MKRQSSPIFKAHGLPSDPPWLTRQVLKAGGRAIFHIDEAMSWESVRNLRGMPPLLLIVRNICMQGKAPEELLANIQEVDQVLKEVLYEFIN
jgi:hypothetical protein